MAIKIPTFFPAQLDGYNKINDAFIEKAFRISIEIKLIYEPENKEPIWTELIERQFAIHRARNILSL